MGTLFFRSRISAGAGGGDFALETNGDGGGFFSAGSVPPPWLNAGGPFIDLGAGGGIFGDKTLPFFMSNEFGGDSISTSSTNETDWFFGFAGSGKSAFAVVSL